MIVDNAKMGCAPKANKFHNINLQQGKNQVEKGYCEQLFDRFLDTLFSSDEEGETQIEQEPQIQVQEEEMSLAESFVNDCLIKPTAEILAEETQNYLDNLFKPLLEEN